MNTSDNKEFDKFKKITNYKGGTREKLIDKIEKFKRTESMSNV